MTASLESPRVPSEEEKRNSLARAKLLRTIAAQTRIQDPRILEAFARVPRERFVPELEAARAYEDAALPIGHGQTISQPSMIAMMLGALELLPHHRVLEVGSGSGYAAALLAQLAREVYAIEILPALAQRARQRLGELGIGNVHVFDGNGRQGLAAYGPYDRILVSAGSEDVPAELVSQLKVGGRIAIPVGDDYGQQLSIGTKQETGEMRWENSVSCIFVPLVGKA